jgi:hypothetical protein
MVIARIELMDEDGGWVEPYGQAITSLDDAVESLITILAAPMAANGSLRIYRDDLTTWRWIAEFVPTRPDAPDTIMALLNTLSRAKGAQFGLPEIAIQAWREFALLALLADAMVLEVDMPGATGGAAQMSLPPTFIERDTLAGWEIIPIIETVDCVVVNGKILHGTTLDEMTDYDAVALEISYANDGADVQDPDRVAVSAERYTLAIMQDGGMMLHKVYRTDYFVTTETRTHSAKRR